MNAEERYIAKIIFKNRVLQYKGQQFEDFFVKIMTKSNIEFQAVKAYGNIGDKKNDGFIRTTGTYFQVFEYSCAVKPQFREIGNRLTGTWEPPYASLLAHVFV